MIFYEAPHKLGSTLRDLAEAFGPERRIALCRELTKLHEEIWRTTLGEAAARYGAEAPRGEFVLVVEGAPQRPAETPSLERGAERAMELRAQGIPLKEAARQAAKELGLSRNEIYALVVRNGSKEGG